MKSIKRFAKWLALIGILSYSLGTYTIFKISRFSQTEVVVNFQKFSFYGRNDAIEQRNQPITIPVTTKSPSPKRSSAKSVRVLCWVMTNPQNHYSKAKTVKNTWGKRCDVLLFISSMMDKSLPTIPLPVEEGRGNLWFKTKEAFKYIYKHHSEDADWFMKADDDTYVIVENLRHFLQNERLDTPLYHGRRFKPWMKQGYMSGGAGYVVNKKALQLLVTKGLNNSDICNPKASKDEDLEIGHCFEKLGVSPGDSRDEKGRERFMSYTLEQHFVPGKLPQGHLNYFYYNYTEGRECCSDYAISFHYISPSMMLILDYFVYHLRVNSVEKNNTKIATSSANKNHADST